jgi:hypothetical protein
LARERGARGRLGRFGRGPRSGVRGPLKKENDFSFIFQLNSPQIPKLSKIKSFLRFGVKTKVAQKKYALQLCQKKQCKIPNRF